MKKIIALLSLVGLVMGCSTPYGSKGFMGGYDDTALGKNRYLVSFEGNGYTSAVDVRKGALRRAGQLCRNDGYESFRVVDSDRNDDTNVSANWNRNSGNIQTVNRHSVSIIVECSRD